jgi:hypothetical protein
MNVIQATAALDVCITEQGLRLSANLTSSWADVPHKSSLAVGFVSYEPTACVFTMADVPANDRVGLAGWLSAWTERGCDRIALLGKNS